jgi:predicted dehydrogenase
MKRVRVGFAGFGFIGPHHAEAMRRLGFVDVAGVCTVDAEETRRKAEQYAIPRQFASFEEMIADPGIDVIDVVTPTYMHYPIAKAAIAAGKHIIVDKPLALTSAQARDLMESAATAGVINAVTFNYRFNPMVQQARVMIARGDVGDIHLVHGHYLQEWLAYPTDFNWRVEPEKSGEAAMMADAGCHWFDLVEHMTGLRVEAVLADFSTTIPVRKRPKSGAREAFAAAAGDDTEDYTVRVPDRGTVLLRFQGGARGQFLTSCLCPGHKNDLRVEINGLKTSLLWEQEKPNVIWLGKRDEADRILTRDPSLVDESVRRYVALPGGHNEAWPDAFKNLMREIMEFVASGKQMAGEIPFPTFADGYRAASIADAMVASSKGGGVWTKVSEA